MYILNCMLIIKVRIIKKTLDRKTTIYYLFITTKRYVRPCEHGGDHRVPFIQWHFAKTSDPLLFPCYCLSCQVCIVGRWYCNTSGGMTTLGERESMPWVTYLNGRHQRNLSPGPILINPLFVEDDVRPNILLDATMFSSLASLSQDSPQSYELIFFTILYFRCIHTNLIYIFEVI